MRPCRCSTIAHAPTIKILEQPAAISETEAGNCRGKGHASLETFLAMPPSPGRGEGSSKDCGLCTGLHRTLRPSGCLRGPSRIWRGCPNRRLEVRKGALAACAAHCTAAVFAVQGSGTVMAANIEVSMRFLHRVWLAQGNWESTLT